MDRKEEPVRVAVDSNLFISLFLDEDENLNDPGRSRGFHVSHNQRR